MSTKGNKQMLEARLRELFEKGPVTISTLSKRNIVTFEVTPDGNYFWVPAKGAVKYPFNKMDVLEREIKLMAKYNPDGKVYFGAKSARTSSRLGDDPWVETTINGILAVSVFNIQEGKTIYDGATYIAALLQKVGFAVMHSTDINDPYITLTGLF